MRQSTTRERILSCDLGEAPFEDLGKQAFGVTGQENNVRTDVWVCICTVSPGSAREAGGMGRRKHNSETGEAGLKVILAKKFPTLQMPSQYQQTAAIPERFYENSDLNLFKWGSYSLLVCLVYLYSRNNWKRCPGIDIFEHLKFQRDATFVLLIIKHILSQMHNRGCTYMCVCVYTCVHM